MRVLLATNHLTQYGGTELWIITMYEALKKFTDAEIDVYSPNVNNDFISKHIPLEAFKGQQIFKTEYDLILVNHKNVADTLRFVKGVKIQTVHGMFNEIERPSTYVNGVVYVSRELFKVHEKKSVGKPTAIFFNPINIDLFKTEIPVNTEVKKVLSLCQGDLANNFLRLTSEFFKWEFHAINKHKNALPPEEIAKAIAGADIVFTLGRGAMEATVMGRQVFILDSRDYMHGKSQITSDGIITIANHELLLKSNFSGRAYHICNPTHRWVNDHITENRGAFIHSDNYLAERFKKGFGYGRILDNYLGFYEQLKNIKK